MKKACLVTSSYLKNNIVFNEKSNLNRDNIFDKYIELQKELVNKGYLLATEDINSIEDSDLILYLDMPKVMPSKNKIKNSYLILRESELIISENYDINKHIFFEKIFTWHDGLIDNKKYFKLNFSHKFPNDIEKKLINKERLCVLIAGNKKVNHPLELYSKRIEAIKWFEKNQPNDFDLYGVGWDRYMFYGAKIIRALNRVPYLGVFFSKITNRTFPSYLGTIVSKKSVMQKYKFSICYENAKNIPGYITEKIFDSFFAGCVPIYWGANNINDYIPHDCFIDKRNFNTYEELFSYIKHIKDEDYLRYLDNISDYLKSEKSFQFKSEYFAKKIVKTILF